MALVGWRDKGGTRGRSYLPVCVERGQGGIQHAASHVSMAIVEGVGDKEEEEGRDLSLVQVLRQFVESQSDATPGGGRGEGEKS